MSGALATPRSPREAAARVVGARETALAVALAATSGVAVVAHAFGPLPMALTVPFVVFPAAALLGGAVLAGRRAGARLHELSARLAAGAAAGLLATLAYDATRVAIVLAAFPGFDAFVAHRVFGHLMTGLPPGAPQAAAAGWAYHFWNGASFGMMFALARPVGGAVWGFAWGLTLEGLMYATYPALLQARVGSVEFLTTSVVGHSVWGLALGAILARWAARRGPLTRIGGRARVA